VNVYYVNYLTLDGTILRKTTPVYMFWRSWQSYLTIIFAVKCSYISLCLTGDDPQLTFNSASDSRLLNLLFPSWVLRNSHLPKNTRVWIKTTCNIQFYLKLMGWSYYLLFFSISYHRFTLFDVVSQCQPLDFGMGFPDFAAPKHLTNALKEVAEGDDNLLHQYTQTFVNQTHIHSNYHYCSVNS